MTPTLPTDNLYKFMALGGLLLVVVSVFATESRLADFERMDTQLAVAIEELHALSKMDPSSVAASPEVALEDLRLHMRTVHDKVFETRRQAELHELELIAVKRLARASVIFAGVGLFLAALGFLLWYQRVQKYQDIIIRQQVAAAEVDTDTSNGDAPIKGSAGPDDPAPPS